MNIWTDREGNKLTPREFFSRWKQGIISISQYEQVKAQIRSTWLVVVGIICGLVISIINAQTLWWLCIVLLGALGNTMVQLISLIQRRNALKQFEHLLQGGTTNGY